MSFSDKTQIADDNKDIINPATKELQEQQVNQTGEVQENPTQYTILDRLKSIGESVASAASGVFASIRDFATGHYAYVTHFGLLKAGDAKPIVASNFAGDKLNKTLWVEQSTGTGGVDLVQGVGNLTVNSVGDKEVLRTRKSGRFVAGQVTIYQSGVFPVGAGVVGNVREWGLASKDEQQKMVFRLNGTALEIVTVRDGAENVITADNFSAIPNYTVSDQNRTWRIDYSAGRALFFDAAGGERRLLHVEVNPFAPLVNGLNMHGHYSNENVSNNTTVLLGVRGSSISILSQLQMTDILFQRDHIEDGVLPSGAPYVVPPIPEANPPANVIDTGYIDREEWEVVYNHMRTEDAPLKLYIINCSNTLGENAEGLIFPSLNGIPFRPATVETEFFQQYVRFVLVNDTGVDAEKWSVESRRQHHPALQVSYALDQKLLKSIPAPVVRTVPSTVLDFIGNTARVIQLDNLSTQTVLLDVAALDPLDYGFPAGTPMKYVALGYDIWAVNRGYSEGNYFISDAGTATMRRIIQRRSGGSGVTGHGGQVTADDPDDFLTSVRLDYATGAGKVFVSGRIDGYITEAV